MAHLESYREDPFSLPTINDSLFAREQGLRDMIWFIAGALRKVEPYPLTPREIFAAIERYQPWRIDVCRGENKRMAAENNIRWILSKSPAFEHDASGRWTLTGKPLVRTANLLPPSLSQSSPMHALTKEELKICLAWADQLFAPFQNSREWTCSEASSDSSSSPESTVYSLDC